MTHSPDHAERAAIVAWLRTQSDIGADYGITADKGSTRRAAYGGGSLALNKAADAIEAGEHLPAALRGHDAKEAGEQGCGEGRDG